MNRCRVFLVLILFCLLASPFTVGVVEGYETILVFDADSDFELGMKVGEQLGLELKWLLSSVEARGYGVSDAVVEGYKEALTEHYPEYLDRVAGLAKSLDTSEEELLRASIVLQNSMEGACTTFAANSRATTDGKIYSGWNLDLYPWLEPILSHPWLFVIKIPGRYTYVGYGVPILLNIGLLNEKGLTSVTTAIPHIQDTGFPGLPYNIINNIVMERCANVREAGEMVDSLPRLVIDIPYARLQNFNLLFADTAGTIALVESSYHYCKCSYSTNGSQASTNHHVYLKSSGSTGSPSSHERLNKIWELLNQNRGKINLEVMKDMMRTEPVCNDDTLCAFIILPEEEIIYFCKGNPSHGTFEPHYFSRYL